MKRFVTLITVFLLAFSSAFGLWEKVSINNAYANSLGRAVGAYTKGLSALAYNPASLLSVQQVQFGADWYTANSMIDNTWAGGATFPVLAAGMCVGVYGSYNYSKFYKEWQADLSVMKSFTEYVGVAVSIKMLGYKAGGEYVNYDIDVGDAKFIFDMDVSAYVVPMPEIQFGLVVKNIFRPDATFDLDPLDLVPAYSLPLTADFSIAYTINDRLTLMADVLMDVVMSHSFSPEAEIGLGVEVPILDMIYIRAGGRTVNVVDAVEVGGGLGFSAVNFGLDLSVDYALVWNTAYNFSSARHYATVTYRLPKPTDERSLNEIEQYKVKSRTRNFEGEDYDTY